MGQRSGIAVSSGVGRRCGSDPALLWLWCRPMATALIRPPSLGTSMCHSVALKKKKKRKKRKKKKDNEPLEIIHKSLCVCIHIYLFWRGWDHSFHTFSENPSKGLRTTTWNGHTYKSQTRAIGSESFVRKLESGLESGDTVNNVDAEFANKLVNQNPVLGTETV